MSKSLLSFAFFIFVHSANATRCSGCRSSRSIENNTSQAWEEYFDHYTFLRPEEDYRLYWKIMDDDFIEIGLEVKSTGWVGFGISDDNTMSGADIIIGWINDNGDTHLQRRHTVSLNDRYPVFDEDLSDDLIAGTHQDGITRLHFIRELFPCADEEDPFIKQIVMGTTFVIFAYNNDNPSCIYDEDDIEECSISQHDISSMGSESINFFSGKSSVVEMPETYDSFEFIMSNYSVPANDTTYHCKFIELPQEITDPSHMIRYDPVIQDGNEAAVHHIILFWCHDFNASYAGFEEDCNAFANMPDFPGRQCKSEGISLAGSVIGAGDFYYPEHVGYPIEGKIYALLEIHYDNPNELTDIVDNSGIKLYWTTELREYEAGAFFIGASYEDTWVPGDISEPVLNSYHSAPQCTENVGIDPIEGIHLFVGLLHAHTIGVSIKLRHIRNNIELPILIQNDNYDFNYQQWVELPNEVTVYPGDEFICECIYDTEVVSTYGKNRVYPTYGGESTRDEMCSCSMFYYPASNFTFGLSTFTDDQYNDFFQTAIDNDWWNGTTNWYNNSMNKESFYYNGKADGALEHYKDFQSIQNRTVICNGCPDFVCNDYVIPEARDEFIPLPDDNFGDCLVELSDEEDISVLTDIIISVYAGIVVLLLS